MDKDARIRELAEQAMVESHYVQKYGERDEELRQAWEKDLKSLFDEAVAAEREAIIQAINAPGAFPQWHCGWDASDALEAITDLIRARGK